jgi:GDP-mannose 6-dehydrogenase
MKIAVFGLGYVGVVSAACLSRDGHSVVGVDVNPVKVDQINSGKSPIIEEGLDLVLDQSVSAGRLSATSDAAIAVKSAELSIVCVGTPGNPNGSLNLSYVEQVCGEIGRALRTLSEWHTVVLRSTMLPGSITGSVIPILEDQSGKRAGVDFGLCFNPEFLREGSAIRDFDEPPKTVVGELNQRSGDSVVALYENLDAPLIRTSIEVAETVKYVDNAWHAAKVSFANEIGRICKASGIDSHAVMDIFCQDTKLNLSSYYLRPGFAFGGSCLPKDLRALNYYARDIDIYAPMLASILPSNDLQIDLAVTQVLAFGRRCVGLLGLSFKSGTDDLRESPQVTLVERLLGKGCEVRVFDENVRLSSLVGSNRTYILEHIPHIGRLLVDDLDALIGESEIIIIANRDESFFEAVRHISKEKIVVDLVRIPDADNTPHQYEGLCW